MKVHKAAVLVIRAWLEEELESNALRARITWTSDPSESVTLETVVASEAEILRAVRVWLRSLSQ